MRKLLWIALFSMGCWSSWAQELNATVSINHSQIGNSNRQVFKTLETALTEFINNTKWSNRNFAANEKIDCVFFLNVSAYDSKVISGSLQVQSSRIIYNSTYASSVFNFNDKDVSFNYTEFENLYYNPNSFDSNLTALVAYYAHLILGFDADTFSSQGGSEYFQNASNMVSLAQQSGFKGWKQADGSNNRYFLINDILSPSNSDFRTALYEYHFGGLDQMADNTKKGKEGVVAALNSLQKLHQARPNSFLMRVFFDAKADEVVSIFAAGPDVQKQKVQETLNKISPLNSSKWNSF